MGRQGIGRAATDEHRAVTPHYDPWQWLHDNDFSWDDVNAIAAILDAGGFDIEARGAVREALQGLVRYTAGIEHGPCIDADAALAALVK
jgi:hypothetical protein